MASGGKRDGSGRKHMLPEKKRVCVTISIAPETKAALPYLKAHGIQLGREVDRLVAELRGKG